MFAQNESSGVLSSMWSMMGYNNAPTVEESDSDSGSVNMSCAVPPTEGENTTYIVFDSEGKPHTMVDDSTAHIVCKDVEKKQQVVSGDWVPFFDQACVAEENRTVLDSGIINIIVVKID